MAAVAVAAVAAQRGHPALFGEAPAKREQEQDTLENAAPVSPRGGGGGGEPRRTQLGFAFLGRFALFCVF